MLKLRGAFSEGIPRMTPLLDGTVQPRDIEIEWTPIDPGRAFALHLRDSAFDVFEMSISSYMVARERARPIWNWTALPVFMTRAWLIVRTLVNANSGIEEAADLRGKRFGVGDYTMTAALWFRAMLRELYGIQPQDISWFVGRQGDHSHGHLLGIDRDPPPGVPITWLSEPDAVARMLRAGEIDASFTDGGLTPGPTVRPLFPDGGRAFVADFYRQTGVTPVNHTVVVQRRVLDENPWAAEALFEAFERSKQEAYRRDRSAAALFSGDDYAWQESVFGADPFPFGLAANRKMLTMTAEQSTIDGLTRHQANVDDLFAESLRGT